MTRFSRLPLADKKAVSYDREVLVKTCCSMRTFVVHSSAAIFLRHKHILTLHRLTYILPPYRCIPIPLCRVMFLIIERRALTLCTQELILSENKLQEIPESLAHLKALRILRLQNNRLKTLPHAIGAVITLEELDCAGNPDLDIVPPPLHSDTAMILWVCRLHKGMASSGRAHCSFTSYCTSKTVAVEVASRKWTKR